MTERRCRSPRVRAPGELRPTDVVGSFFIAGVAFLVAAGVAGAVHAASPWTDGRWLALHLAFVGGVSQLVLGASQFFAGAFLAADPPPRRLVRIQLAGWNAGSLLLAVGVVSDSGFLTIAAAGLLLGALAAYGLALRRLTRASLRSGNLAVRWYAAGAALFAVGIVAGAKLAVAPVWPHGDLLGAHMTLNLAGWFGTAIVATLHTFYPSLTQTTLRFPRCERWTFAAWVGGVVALACGYAWSLDLAARAGWLALLAAAALLLANVAASARAAKRPVSLPARIVGLAQPFLLAALVVASVSALTGDPAAVLTGGTRSAIAVLLVAGWIGLTVLGSLLHLLAVVIRVRNFARAMPAPRPRRDGIVALTAGAGVAALALAQGAGLDGLMPLAGAALALAYAFLGAKVLALAARVVTQARPSV